MPTPDPRQRFRATRVRDFGCIIACACCSRTHSGQRAPEDTRSLPGRGASGPVPSEISIRRIRRDLFPATLGPCPPELVRQLPEDIEGALGGGIVDNQVGFDLPRSDVRRVVERLRTWLASERGRTIKVSDPRLRPFLWRLLSTERPYVYVVAEEEML